MAKDNNLENLTDFDPDFGPEHPINIGAAKQRGWAYNSKNGCYVDEDGCLMADEYGQPF